MVCSTPTSHYWWASRPRNYLLLAGWCVPLCFLINLIRAHMSLMQTGFSFPTLAIFHWWIAALLFLLACIHIGGAVHADSPHVNPTLPHNHYQVSRQKTTPTSVYSQFVFHQAWGIVAFVFFIVLFFSSGRWVRNRFSQIFMPAHIAAFLIALVSPSIRPTLGKKTEAK